MAQVASPQSDTKRQRISSGSPSPYPDEFQTSPPIKIDVSNAYIVKRGRTSPTSGVETPPEEYEQDTRDIRLPNHLSVIKHVAVDIGGSLAKVVYFSREPGNASGGRLHFLRFETDKIDACIEFIHDLQREQREALGDEVWQGQLCVMATGGGAFKYYDRMKRALNVDVDRRDEMQCLIRGLDFFITQIPREVFTYDDTDGVEPIRYVSLDTSAEKIYPYLLVNIGSGVSMIQVSGPDKYQRIGGTSLGGGTLWGLLSLLTGARTFDEMLALSEMGDNAGVDLLVGDIYGDGMGYEKIGLSEKTIASSFGKVFKRKREAERSAEDGNGMLTGDEAATEVTIDQQSAQIPEKQAGGKLFRNQDISRSLLYAVRCDSRPLQKHSQG